MLCQLYTLAPRILKSLTIKALLDEGYGRQKNCPLPSPSWDLLILRLPETVRFSGRPHYMDKCKISPCSEDVIRMETALLDEVTGK